MARPIGLAKTGGRKKGTPNRKSLDLQKALHANGLDIVREISELLPSLSPEKRADVLIDLMTFVYPRRKAVEVSEVEKSSEPKVTIYLPDNGQPYP